MPAYNAARTLRQTYEEVMLACGYEGIGRLWKVDEIAFRVEFLLARQENLIA